jgi:2-amino-4-hydroxy-6-hydroxymethyldihydropteridine diphosphokinase
MAFPNPESRIPNLDRVFIEGLEIEAQIGIYDWERRIRQPLLFDLEMAFDNRKPAASDAIADTLDYKAVSKRLVAFVSASSFGLVETLAERCAEIVLREFGVESLKLKLSKPGAVRGARAVGVMIERDRASLPPEPVQAAEPAEEAPKPAAKPAPTAVQLAAARAFARRLEESIAQAASPPPPAKPAAPASHAHKAHGPTVTTYISLGSNIQPERNLRSAVEALRARFGEVRVSPVYRTRAVGFEGPDFLNAIAVLESDMHPFALNDWLHALEIAHGRDRRDKSYSDRTLDLDIIYFGKLVLEGPGDFMLPRPELRHAFVLKPLADVAPHFVDPVRGATLETLWESHPEHATPPEPVAIEL